jgi:hypothetical protein
LHLLFVRDAAGKPDRAVLVLHADGIFLHFAAIAEQGGDTIGGRLVLFVRGQGQRGRQGGERGNCPDEANT